MRIITTIEVKMTTHNKLQSIGCMGHSFDDVINRLLKDHEVINKYIQEYIDKADGKCINDVILGRRVVANHHFCVEDGKCEKCHFQGPIINRQSDIVIDNEIGHR